MLIRPSTHPVHLTPPASEITPRAVFLDRRRLLAGAAGLGLSALSGASVGAATPPGEAPRGPHGGVRLETRPGPFSTEETPNSYRDITTYNNFYEFGLGKSDPAAYAHTLTTAPWTVTVEGMVANPRTYALEDLLKGIPLEERIYRMRCVEGWSMVIPWVGVPLAAVLERLEPLGSAKFVAFETLFRPSEMPGQRARFSALPWPYVEGLRLDEAMNPLTLLATGLYGEAMPNQNGAPLRLVVPWKYGFKSIKSITRIRLTSEMPVTSWNKQAPQEYGFYANVNPGVDHPRWSQATERRIGEGSGLLARRRPTLLFNGYAEQVAHLYAGMDLARFY